ncbi:MAG: hypothetical protein B7733_04735 [Myxococcales bacterium FL481]|nr:MAG: hypothetical protein B7733_04735 [Myxococcales bacterium FL481]
MHSLAVLTALISTAAPGSPDDLEPSVRALFDDACTMCHDATDDAIDLESDYAALIGAPSSGDMPMITPGDPARSYLYVKIAGGPALHGDLMPLDEDPLSAEQIALVRDWIRAIPPQPQTAGSAAPSTTGGVATPPSAETPSPSDSLQDSITPPPRRSRAAFPGTHQIALHTTTTLGAQTYEFRVHHRFGRVGDERSYGGLRGGATISLGSGYGVTDDFDLLLRFSTSRLDWEFGGKYVPLKQEEDKPLSLGLFASAELLTEEPERASNRLTGSFQLMISRLWLERIASQATVGYSLLTNHSPRPRIDYGEGPEPVRDNRGTLNVGVAATLLLGKKKRHGIDLEYILPVPAAGATPDVFYFRGGDADPNGTTIGSWSAGWSARTGLHLFQVFVTNTRSIHTNLVAPGGDLGSPFSEWGEFFLGFNLSRRWKF